jgi:hypothetical protein
LTSFSINDVHLDESPTPPVLDADGEFLTDLFADFFILETIILENMHNTSSVEQILDVLGGLTDLHLHITHCPLHPSYNFEGHLSLKDIDADQDLVAFLTGCISQKLDIDGCPGFSDELLNAMMSPESSDDWHKMPSCTPFVQDLSILNCTDFSISTLKKVIETRRTQAIGVNPFVQTMPPRICLLRLSGRVPDVSEEDREWFKSLLSDFSYDPIL